MVILAVDSGTTTTRAWLVEDGRVLAGSSGRGGARNVARGDDGFDLLSEVRAVAEDALRRSGRRWTDVEALVAFGMITSELGLEEVQHVEAPADRDDLASSLRRWAGNRFPAPVYLVPGVRRGRDDEVDADLMRGEETEVMGLLATGQTDPPLLYLSTGSHTKFVVVDGEGRIAWSMTTLSGELLWALHRETILSEIVDPAGELHDLQAVREGALVSGRDGLSRALFAARVLNRLGRAEPATCSDFVHGAVAGADVVSLRAALGRRGHPPPRVVIGGNTPLAAAYRELLRDEDWVDTLEETDRPLGALGAWALFAEATRQPGEGPR